MAKNRNINGKYFISPLNHLAKTKKYRMLKNGMGPGSNGILSKNITRGETAYKRAAITPVLKENSLEPILYIKTADKPPNKIVRYPPARGSNLNKGKTPDNMYVHKGP